ncbi:MAG: phosphotransferase [Symbiobacteriia bacterium]
MKLFLCMARPFIPGSMLVPGGVETPADELLRRFFPGDTFSYAAYMGTGGTTQKYTIACIDSHGHARAFIKLGIGPRAGRSIIHEAQTLQVLHQGPIHKAAFPELLHLGHFESEQLSVQSAPTGAYRRGLFRIPRSVLALSRDVFEAEKTFLTWADSPVRARLLNAQRALEHQCEYASQVIGTSERWLDRSFGAMALPHGRTHGDYTLNNICVASVPFIFDWEWSMMSLPLYDAYHLLLLPMIKRNRVTSLREVVRSKRIRRYLSLAAPRSLPLPLNDERWLYAYLAQLYAFYAEDMAANCESLDHPLIRTVEQLLASSRELLSEDRRM